MLGPSHMAYSEDEGCLLLKEAIIDEVHCLIGCGQTAAAAVMQLKSEWAGCSLSKLQDKLRDHAHTRGERAGRKLAKGLFAGDAGKEGAGQRGVAVAM